MKKEKKKNRGGFDRSAYREGLRQRLKEGQKRMQGISLKHLNIPNEVKVFNPGKGDHTIDVIPYKAGSKDPVVKKGSITHTCQYFVHKDGPEWFLCPQENWGHPCPKCEERKRLQDAGEDKEVWKKLYPRERNLYNVVCYDSEKEEEKGVQVWDVPFFYMEENLLLLCKGPQRRSKKSKTKIEPFVDFADPDNGKSISFEIEPPASKDDYTSFSGHKLVDRDYEIEDEILEQAHKLDSFLVEKTYDELKKLCKASGKKSKDSAKRDFDPDDLDDMDKDEMIDLIDDYDLDINKKKASKMKEKELRKVLRKLLEEAGDEDEEEDDLEDEIDDDEDSSEDDDDSDSEEDEDSDGEDDDDSGDDEDSDDDDDSGDSDEEEDEDDDTEEDSCPHDYKFGVDHDKKKKCKKCEEDTYEACLAEKRRLKKGKDEKRR